MKRIRRILVVLAIVASVNVAPAASAGPIEESCQGINTTLQGYGWHGEVC